MDKTIERIIRISNIIENELQQPSKSQLEADTHIKLNEDYLAWLAKLNKLCDSIEL